MPRICKAVITAAGRGTRQYPASSAMQKEMFPLVDRDGLTKPVIQIIGEEALDSGIEELCIITQPGDEKLYREYFRRMNDAEARAFRGKEWAILASEKLASFGDRVHFVEQHTPDGFGHAVYQAKQFVADEPFLLLLGDHIYVNAQKERCARQLMQVYEQNDVDAVTAVQPTLERLLHLFGVIRGEPSPANNGTYKALRIIEKPSAELARRELITPGLPAGNYLAHFGMWIFNPGIFDSIEYLIKNNLREKGEIQLTSAQEHFRQQSTNYWAAIINGHRYDTGIPYGLMETQLALALNSIHRAEICEAIARILATQAKQ
ncbi:MAG: sugar phosphate nucleotidyltransferase [Phycisphaerales bacterium]|nr:sugar phosphate nucleotidyltransferase [Phycisphaerales bacterium]